MGLGAIFNSYKDSCQHLLEAAVYSCGGLAFAFLSDSLNTLKATYLSFIAEPVEIRTHAFVLRHISLKFGQVIDMSNEKEKTERLPVSLK